MCSAFPGEVALVTFSKVSLNHGSVLPFHYKIFSAKRTPAREEGQFFRVGMSGEWLRLSAGLSPCADSLGVSFREG